MKHFWGVCCLLVFSVIVLAQDYVRINGKTYTIDSKTKTYHYKYALVADTFQIHLLDSTSVLRNNLKTVYVLKNNAQKGKQGIYEEVYMNRLGRDSIRRSYEHHQLLLTEEFVYDVRNKLSKSYIKHSKDPTKNKECKYIHKDSITAEGRTNTMFAFKTYAKMLHGYDYQIKTYLDKQSDTLRHIRIDKYGETIILNKYRSSRRDQKEINYTKEVQIETCDLENKQQIINNYLWLVKPKIEDKEYISLDYNFHTYDNAISVFIKRNRKNNYQEAFITIKEK